MYDLLQLEIEVLNGRSFSLMGGVKVTLNWWKKWVWGRVAMNVRETDNCRNHMRDYVGGKSTTAKSIEDLDNQIYACILHLQAFCVCKCFVFTYTRCAFVTMHLQDVSICNLLANANLLQAQTTCRCKPFANANLLQM
jgi:hypothetical protein